jgi:EthD domain
VTLTKFSLLKRRADLTPAQFSEHWRHTHVKVLVEQGGHKTYNLRYVQNHVIPDCGLDFVSEAFDGAAQMVPQNEGVVSRGFQEDPLYLRFVRPDEDRFLDVACCVVLYCRSDTLLEDSQPGAIKLLELLKRRPDQTHAQFMQSWRERHAGLLMAQPDVWRYVCGYAQHEVLQDATRGMAAGERDRPDMAYDGVSELRFGSLAELQVALASTAYHEVVLADTARWVGHSQSFVVREEFIYDDS